MTTATEELAAFCIDELTYEDLPDDVILRAKEYLMDSGGIAICAAEYDSSDAVRAAVETMTPGDGMSTVWATGDQYSSEYPSLPNATHVHTLEYDVTHSDGCASFRLQGTFSCADRWSGRWTASFSGSCSFCSGQDDMVQGTRQ
jgi:2-methylcitrate dehydratase PrpD